jgi:hypothetical protein
VKKLNYTEAKKEYLQTLYEMSEGNPFREIKLNDLSSRLNSTNDQQSGIMSQQKLEGFVTYTFGLAMITPLGCIEVEKEMEKTYAEKELLVLKTIYNLAKNLPNNEVHYSEVYRAVNLPSHEMIKIQMELYDNKKYLMPSSDETLKVSPAGEEFLEGKSNMPKTTGDTYNTNNYAPSINQIGGSHNTLYAQMNLNPEFEKLIAPVLDLIRSSEMSKPDKDEFIQDIQSINRLISENPKRAEAKFNYLDTALKATDIGVKLLPYTPAIYAFFESLIQKM